MLGCANEKPTYFEKVNNQRRFKDIQFKNENSPIPKTSRADFKGLKYFNPDSNFIVFADVEWDFDVEEKVLYKEAREDAQHYPIAKLKFKLEGQKFVLIGFSEKRSVPEVLFVPFYDLTSGKETYGGGRYVDVKLSNKKQVKIDFNQAYNPYCVYNSNYVCAIPPFENDLKIKILAGEKMPFIDEGSH